MGAVEVSANARTLRPWGNAGKILSTGAFTENVRLTLRLTRLVEPGFRADRLALVPPAADLRHPDRAREAESRTRRLKCPEPAASRCRCRSGRGSEVRHRPARGGCCAFPGDPVPKPSPSGPWRNR